MDMIMISNCSWLSGVGRLFSGVNTIDVPVTTRKNRTNITAPRTNVLTKEPFGKRMLPRAKADCTAKNIRTEIILEVSRQEKFHMVQRMLLYVMHLLGISS